jgi:hypothetical protein
LNVDGPLRLVTVSDPPRAGPASADFDAGACRWQAAASNSAQMINS